MIYIFSYKSTIVNVIRTGIAWDSDKRNKFINPKECKLNGTTDNNCLKEKFKHYAKPQDWKLNLWELDTENSGNNGLENEDLIVWMRPAAFSNFKKLYRKINHDDWRNLALSEQFKRGIPKGNYSLIIEYNYEVASFSGEKQIILSTTSLLGNKNSFLGLAYISVGGFCILLGIATLLVHIKYGEKLHESMDITSATPYKGNETF